MNTNTRIQPKDAQDALTEIYAKAGNRNPREAINHGHNDWNGTEWVPTFHKWCGICREAQQA
jgi:hypothetical protein